MCLRACSSRGVSDGLISFRRRFFVVVIVLRSPDLVGT